jgi:uncharacterized protein involved in exopolysaccharide biosynthesis
VTQSLRYSPQQAPLELPAADLRSEISLGDLVSVLRRWKLALAAAAGIAVIGAGVLAWIMPPTFVAQTLVAPVSSGPSGGQFGNLSSMLGELGGLASLAGIAGSANQQAIESTAVLESEALTERYIAQNNLLPVLYHKQWDAGRRAWKVTDPDKVPTLWKANRYFQHKVRGIVTDPKTNLVTLTVKWTDPHVAADWANGLVRMTNDYLRKQAIDEAERNIAYLNQQAAITDVVAVKQAIYTLLQSQINKEMVARGTEEYAFKVLDPAIAPERKSSPQPMLWIVVALAASQILAVLAAYIHLAWKRAQPLRPTSERT